MSKIRVTLMVGARTFMKATKKGTMFAIYATPISELALKKICLPIRYEGFQDVFEKKNADTLHQHCPYDCAIELQEGAQPPLDQSMVFHKMSLLRCGNTLTKILPRISYNILNLQQKLLSFLQRKRWLVDFCSLNKITIKN